jgi:hypothetical protein
MAALDGVRQAGYPVEIDGCDLTERRMYVRVVCEQGLLSSTSQNTFRRDLETGA